jgi:ElaA protein
MEIDLKKFDELSVKQLHAIYQLRSAVFVVEQNCAYQEIDEMDLDALHLQFFMDKKLVAYCRIIAPNLNSPHAQIGRVVVSSKHRKTGLGKQLMNQAIKKTLQIYPNRIIHISAQTYLLKFYRELGFKDTGETYLEDGIPHVGMNYVG